jgi:hypothetical protein
VRLLRVRDTFIFLQFSCFDSGRFFCTSKETALLRNFIRAF